jgi:ATP-dependent Clp protease ATP-binding subunit ClpX
MENATLEFTPEALRAVAREAMRRDVGARALRAVVEEVMLELLYELPESKEHGNQYEITPEMVTGQVKPTLFTAVKKRSA